MRVKIVTNVTVITTNPKTFALKAHVTLMEHTVVILMELVFANLDSLKPTVIHVMQGMKVSFATNASMDSACTMVYVKVTSSYWQLENQEHVENILKLLI